VRGISLHNRKQHGRRRATSKNTDPQAKTSAQWTSTCAKKKLYRGYTR